MTERCQGQVLQGNQYLETRIGGCDGRWIQFGDQMLKPIEKKLHRQQDTCCHQEICMDLCRRRHAFFISTEDSEVGTV